MHVRLAALSRAQDPGRHVAEHDLADAIAPTHGREFQTIRTSDPLVVGLDDIVSIRTRTSRIALSDNTNIGRSVGGIANGHVPSGVRLVSRTASPLRTDDAY